MASPTLSQDQPLPDEDNDVLLPSGWADASPAQDADDEPNVLRGLD
jgi:hypothetical protein